MTRVALVHDWLVAHRGGEKVLLEIARLFPDAPILTLVFAPELVHPELRDRTVSTSFIQGLPGAPERFRRYLPLFPKAIEQFDLRGFDLVISTSHCVAKGVRSRAPHLSYVHTPMRYIWDQMPSYMPSGFQWATPAVRAAVTPLRRWDVESAERPTRLLANSAYVAERIRRFWGRDAQVLHPPVELSRFSGGDGAQRHGWLTVNALVPYKRTELAVELATQRGERLVVVGDGAERERLQQLAGPTVEFRTQVSDDALAELYARSELMIHGGVEDFGIAPVEAMASGCPVVALGEGGVTETVRSDESGVFFLSPTPQALGQAIDRLRGLWAAGSLSEQRIR
ncbi:MAG: glycosyltransferase, partial [Myxococcota bacterium]